MLNQNFKFSSVAKSVSAANAIIFNMDYIFLTDILYHWLYLDFSSWSTFCRLRFVHLTLCFLFIEYYFIICILYLFSCAIVFVPDCNWPCLLWSTRRNELN
jgi:hypothetical protein